MAPGNERGQMMLLVNAPRTLSFVSERCTMTRTFGIVLCICLWISVAKGSQRAQRSAVSAKDLVSAKTTTAFNALAQDYGVYSEQGASCQAGQGADSGSTVCTSCAPVFGLCSAVYESVLQTNETALNATATNDLYHVYIYGSFMVTLMSVMSLACLIFVPCLRGAKHSKAYKGMRLCVLASGASALFCYCIFFLMMEVFRLNISPSDNNPSLIKCVVIIAGMYFFYLLEFTLHLFSGGHSHGNEESHVKTKDVVAVVDKSKGRLSVVEDMSPQNGFGEVETAFSDVAVLAEDKQFRKKWSFVDPSPFQQPRIEPPLPPWHHITSLSWLIGVGDAMRNFVDGLTFGVALNMNFTLGIATAIMLVIYEIPLEFGNFVLLLDNGVRWWVAVIFNIVSSLLFCAGLIAGAILGEELDDVNVWIMSILFGLYSYIALVNLIPELVSVHEGRLLAFIMTNFGFFFSFGVLYVPAHFRDSIETLFSTNSTNIFPS